MPAASHDEWSARRLARGFFHEHLLRQFFQRLIERDAFGISSGDWKRFIKRDTKGSSAAFGCYAASRCLDENMPHGECQNKGGNRSDAWTERCSK